MRTFIVLLLPLTALILPAGKPHGPAATCATNAQRALGAFLGEYEVRATFRAGAAAWDSSLARSHFAWDLDGCVLVERFDGRRFGEPYRYLSLWGAGADSGRPIQQMFVHSQHGVLSLSQGDWNPTRDTLIVEDSAFVSGGVGPQTPRHVPTGCRRFRERRTSLGKWWEDLVPYEPLALSPPRLKPTVSRESHVR